MQRENEKPAVIFSKIFSKNSDDLFKQDEFDDN